MHFIYYEMVIPYMMTDGSRLAVFNRTELVEPNRNFGEFGNGNG